MLLTERYVLQVGSWPKSGRHILAQADAESVIVYQAYRQSIGDFAVRNGHFGGGFSYGRMSWIKPNFLWMMYRSGWGTKPGQEMTLAIRIRRELFDTLLAQAVESTFSAGQYKSQEEWQKAVRASAVRFQWDPDHSPRGAPLTRRALQLGLRGRCLKDFGTSEVLEILDISDFVAEQRENTSQQRLDELITPAERVYISGNQSIQIRLGLD